MTETRDSLIRRAGRGTAAVVVRSVLGQGVALLGIAFVSRRLGPHEFGMLAAGLAASAFAVTFADGGLSAGLIRGAKAPSRRDLQVTLGLQLFVMSALATVLACAFLPFGRAGLVSGLVLIGVPIVALQTPGRIVLERRIAYTRIAVCELTQISSYWALAVVAVLSGFGVWGVAVANVVGTAASSALLLILTPEARVRPRFSWRESRGLLSFGAAYQAVSFTNLIRDQGLNAALVGVLGLSALGVWSVAVRLIQLPLTIFNAVWRVSYPTMARVVMVDRAPTALLQRATCFAALSCAVILVPLGASATNVTRLLFGPEWAAAGPTVTGACVALLIGGPISLAVGGYLYAVGEVRAVLWSAVAHTVAWFAVSMPLMPLIGVKAVGIGWIAGAATDAIILGRAARSHAGFSPLASCAAVITLGVLSGSLGLVVGGVFGRSNLSLLASFAASELPFVAITVTYGLVGRSNSAAATRLFYVTIWRRARRSSAPPLEPAPVTG